MHVHGMNILAVLVSALSAFLLGGPWYSNAMFLKPWARHSRLGDNMGEKVEGKHKAMVFILSFLFSLISAFAFAWWLGPSPALGYAVGRGALAGAGFVAASFGINYQFANRSMVLWAIDGGYHTVQFILFGLILGLWH